MWDRDRRPDGARSCGLAGTAGKPFNMAIMGMHLAEFRNGVSKLHGEVSREMFAHLWPGVPEQEVPARVGHQQLDGPTWVSRCLTCSTHRSASIGT